MKVFYNCGLERVDHRVAGQKDALLDPFPGQIVPVGGVGQKCRSAMALTIRRFISSG